MITFKQFLAEEVIASKRKSMMHLQQMKPVEFVKWAKSIHSDLGGVLKNVEVSLKVDGLGARFGKDDRGRFFFEGSRTGPIFEPKAFSSYAKSKGHEGEMLSRSEKYDDLYDELRDSNIVEHLPNDTKVICEILYSPMARLEGSKSIFVSVKYDTRRLGSLMTIVPISVVHASSGERRDDEDQILAKMYKLSRPEIKVVDPKLSAARIDIRGKIKGIEAFDDEALRVLQSLKAADKPRKQELIAAIQTMKDNLAQYLLDHEGIEGKDKLGDEIEGLVFDINGQPIKVTTQDFKDAKKASKK